MTTAVISSRTLNFSAGPATLPDCVVRQAQEDLWDLFGTGIGIMEHSHRGPAFERVLAEAEADCRELGGIPDDFAVLFLQGGASTQFATIPMNFLRTGGTADYADTGVWTHKAIKEAKRFGTVNLAFDGSTCAYDHTPTDDELTCTSGADYFHYCSNNTIYGTRFIDPPRTDAPLFADMSSEMFSRPIDWSRHPFVYAGAQKNLGPAGVTLVVARRDLLEQRAEGLPSMFDYALHMKKGSRLNTPPTFPIYVVGRVMKWMLERGGLESIDAANVAKAAPIYAAIDGSGGFYTGVSRPECRSLMNISFRCATPELDAAFIAEAKAHGMDGLKGHRDAGGLRASTYNAFPEAGCLQLAEFMNAFCESNG